MRLIDTELWVKLQLLGTLVIPVALCWLLILAEFVFRRFGAVVGQQRGLAQRSYVQPERSKEVNTRISL